MQKSEIPQQQDADEAKELSSLMQPFLTPSTEVDTILVCQGYSLHVLKMDLTRCSPYFATLFNWKKYNNTESMGLGLDLPQDTNMSHFSLPKDIEVKSLLLVLRRICYPLNLQSKVPTRKQDLIEYYKLLHFLV